MDGIASAHNTKRSQDTANESKRKKNDQEDDADETEKSRKLGPPVPLPGVNSSSFLAIMR